MPAICVFCGAQKGTNSKYEQAAEAFGKEMAKRGLDLIHGGGTVGLMGAISLSVHNAGGKVTGIIPSALNYHEREKIESFEGELVVVKTMHERKALMGRLCDYFVALPGGLGTLEELSEVINWQKLGIHHKPIGILNLDGFYDPFLKQIEKFVEEGFLERKFMDIIVVRDDPVTLLAAVLEHKPPKGMNEPHVWMLPELEKPPL